MPFSGPTKTVYILHNSEQPASVFSILDSGTKQIPLVADALFDLLIVKMNPYIGKKGTKIEAKGPRFEFGDFLIKLGSVSMGPTFKGVLVEVEYRPCFIPANCWNLIKEFMQGFLGAHGPTTDPAYFRGPSTMTPGLNKYNDPYQAIDTIQQYLEHFINYRKQSSI